MTAKTDAKTLICVESFVGYYDGEGLHQFTARKDRTIIAADSREAKLWGKFFEPVDGTARVIDQALYPEQATSGEQRA